MIAKNIVPVKANKKSHQNNMLIIMIIIKIPIKTIIKIMTRVMEINMVVTTGININMTNMIMGMDTATVGLDSQKCKESGNNLIPMYQ